MAVSNRRVVAASVGVGALIVVWLGAGMYGSGRAEAALKAFAERPSSETGLRIQNLRHQAGPLSSFGTFEVQVADQCGVAAGASSGIEVSYALSHLILPTSPMRIEWSARPLGELAQDLAAVLGPNVKLQGAGKASFGGELSSSMSLPELAVSENGWSFNVAPSRGTLAVGATALAMNWTVDKVVARGRGEALELVKLGVVMDLKNRYLGTGTTALTVDRVSTSHGMAEGFRHATEVVQNGDRLDLKLSETLRVGQFGGKAMKDLVFEMAVKNMDAKSVETIGRLVSDSCGMQNLTSEEGSRLRQAVRTLLIKGFAFGIPRIAGTVGGGSVDGSLSLEAREAASATAPIALASMFRSSGELLLKGDAVSAEQKQMLISIGAAQEVPGGLKASFEYGEGVLRTNGHIFDGSQMHAALSHADGAVNAFLDGPRLAAAPAPVAAPEAEEIIEPVAAPAVAAAATPAMPTAECAAPRPCLALSLKAAAREDIDGVRAIATRFDTLGKPDLGNRAVSRKLNSEGLEALKRDDPVAAAGFFRRGLVENPRDVELAGNLGFALIKAGKPQEAVEVLNAALLLDPRRTSTWTPLAEALALAGHKEEAQAALWISFQWSPNRDKSLAFYADRSSKEQGLQPALAELYGTVLGWVAEGRRPAMKLAAG